METILYPVNHGTFAFTGMTVLQPFVAYGPGRASEEERAAELDRYAQYLGNLNTVTSASIASGNSVQHS